MEISFGKNTSAGNVLKKLRNITCPYTGVKMISGSDIGDIERRIDKCANASEIIGVLGKYTDYIQNVEKAII